MNFEQAADVIRKREYYNPFQFLGLITSTDIVAEGNLIVSAEENTTDLLEIGTSGIVPVDLDALIHFFTIFPTDIDLDYPVGFRLNYSLEKATDPVSFSLGLNLTGTVIVPGTSLATLTYGSGGSVADVSASSTIIDRISLWTNRITNKYTHTKAQVEAGSALAVQIAGSVYVNITSLWILGLEIDYVPQMCIGEGRDLDVPLGNFARTA